MAQQAKVYEANMVIGVTRAQQVEIEEHCVRHGLDFGAYFMGLHEDRKIMQHEMDQIFENEVQEEKNATKNLSEVKDVKMTVVRPDQKTKKSKKDS